MVHGQNDPPYSSISTNYVRSWNAKGPVTDGSSILLGSSVQNFQISTNYFDGLGRPLQSVTKQGSLPTATGLTTDFVQTVEYDVYGREQYKHLPFAASSNDGSFKTDPFVQQNSFYSDANGILKGQNESNFYGQKVWEASALQRVQKSLEPGASWIGQSRGVDFRYYNNTSIDEVRQWRVQDGTEGVFSTYSLDLNQPLYPPGQLYKTITEDEQHNQVIEFKDKEGKVIMKKVQLTSLNDNGSGKNHEGWLCTYYIYNDLNELKCVIQPKAVDWLQTNGWNFSNTGGAEVLDELCFRYEYDYRGRMIIKKIPGAEAVSMVYDQLDRLVMSQDGNMRNNSKWLVNKFDKMNRLKETGIWSNSTPFTIHIVNAKGSSNYPVTDASYITMSETNYDNYDLLPSSLSSTLNNSGYANYLNESSASPYYAEPVIAGKLGVRGVVTWTRTKIIDENKQIATVNIYDYRGRVIQTQSQNYTGAVDVATNQYNFSGQVLRQHLKHNYTGSTNTSIEIATKNTYDFIGRVIKIEKNINGGGWTSTVTMGYDGLGQLANKSIGRKQGSNTALGQLEYNYNIRGWLLGINKSYLTDASNQDHYFGMELGYDKNPVAGTFSSVYNGNISGTIWKSEGDGKKRKYDFAYDASNRLTNASFSQYTSGTGITAIYNLSDGIDYTVSNIGYDANGNLSSMWQKGWKISGSNFIDQLSYQYYSNSNKLMAVTDAITDNKMGDFTDKNIVGADYGYDKNGNMVSDLNKKINGATGLGLTAGGAITYNFLNLPQAINVVKEDNSNAKGSISYSYDGNGTKWRKQTIENNAVVRYKDVDYTTNITTTTFYLGGFIYETKSYSNTNLNDLAYIDKLQFFQHEEGRVRPKDNSFVFDYFIKDHLGNVRMVLTEEQQQSIYPAATLENVSYNGGTAISVEKQYFTIDESKIVAQSIASGIPVYQNNNGNPPYNNNIYSNTTANSARLYQMNATTNKLGLGIALKVMAGDKINIYGKSYHKKPSGQGYKDPVIELSVLDIISAFTASPLLISKQIAASSITNQPNFPSTLLGLLGSQPTQISSQPRAAINWIIFDEQFKYVGGGFDRVGDAVNTNGTFKNHDINTIPTIFIPRNGYIYVYCSNESTYNVFFDNLQLIHTRGPILEETHYYPFGLTMSGISSKALNFGGAENKKKFNAGSELQNKEFSDGNGLEMYDTKYRGLDPQLGRWWQLDPKPNYDFSLYSAFDNNPILHNDPLGDSLPPPPKGAYNWMAPLMYQGYANIKASNTRTWYNNEAAKLNPSDKQGRLELKEKARAETPEPFKSTIQKGRPLEGERAKVNDPNFKGNAAKTNVEVNEAAATTKVLGKAFIVAGVSQSAYTIATSKNPGQEAVTEGAGWAGALWGGSQGAEWGASIGGPWGGFIGGVIGSAGGFFLGKNGSQAVIEGTKDAAKQNQQNFKRIDDPSVLYMMAH
jgi:RHS repeat-associated protein